VGLGAHDGSDDLGPVAVVLRLVGGVDIDVHARGGLGEGDVPLQTAGPDSTYTARLRTAEPRLSGP
jgi:hypothetical protein